MMGQIINNMLPQSTQFSCYKVIVFKIYFRMNYFILYNDWMFLHIVACQAHPALVKIGPKLAPSF